MNLKSLNARTAVRPKRKERIIQFGEGNFLRAFAEWIVQQMNDRAGFDGSVVIVKPRPGSSMQQLVAQDCLYHVCEQGLRDGHTVDDIQLIDSVSRAINPYDDNEVFLALARQPELRFVISNTTEAGIVFDPACRFSDAPAASYPAKLTQLLFARYRAFGGSAEAGLIILPCELIFGNGRHLAECIHRYIDLWHDELGADADAFRSWVDTSCHICTTLVDRIVPGRPEASRVEALQERAGYADALMVAAEPYHLWVIETPPTLSHEQLEREFPARRAGLNVVLTHDETPYHERKVTLLNGPHSVLAPVAFLAGLDIVRDACQHPVVGRYVKHVMYNELMPTLALPEDELRQFAADVLERFCNPYIDHQLTSIMLNSMSKFCTRDLPALLAHVQRVGCPPAGIVLGLAAIVVCYRGGTRADGQPIVPNDDPRIVQLLADLWQDGDARRVAQGVLGADIIWGERGDLNAVPGLTDSLAADIKAIVSEGMMPTLQRMLA